MTWREKHIRRVKLWQKKNKKLLPKYTLTWRYGKKTNQHFTNCQKKQKNKCAICKESMNRPCMDHNKKCCPAKRSCGKCLRKLLCNSCNLGLGFFKDSPRLLLQAHKYLKTN